MHEGRGISFFVPLSEEQTPKREFRIPKEGERKKRNTTSTSCNSERILQASRMREERLQKCQQRNEQHVRHAKQVASMNRDSFAQSCETRKTELHTQLARAKESRERLLQKRTSDCANALRHVRHVHSVIANCKEKSFAATAIQQTWRMKKILPILQQLNEILLPQEICPPSILSQGLKSNPSENVAPIPFNLAALRLQDTKLLRITRLFLRRASFIVPFCIRGKAPERTFLTAFLFVAYPDLISEDEPRDQVIFFNSLFLSLFFFFQNYSF